MELFEQLVCFCVLSDVYDVLPVFTMIILHNSIHAVITTHTRAHNDLVKRCLCDVRAHIFNLPMSDEDSHGPDYAHIVK